jgi:hypothetical protein
MRLAGHHRYRPSLAGTAHSRQAIRGPLFSFCGTGRTRTSDMPTSTTAERPRATPAVSSNGAPRGRRSSTPTALVRQVAGYPAANDLCVVRGGADRCRRDGGCGNSVGISQCSAPTPARVFSAPSSRPPRAPHRRSPSPTWSRRCRCTCGDDGPWTSRGSGGSQGGPKSRVQGGTLVSCPDRKAVGFAGTSHHSGHLESLSFTPLSRS